MSVTKDWRSRAHRLPNLQTRPKEVRSLYRPTFFPRDGNIACIADVFEEKLLFPFEIGRLLDGGKRVRVLNQGRNAAGFIPLLTERHEQVLEGLARLAKRRPSRKFQLTQRVAHIYTCDKLCIQTYAKLDATYLDLF